MIQSMKKYSFLVYHKDYTEFLDELRTLGVLHIESGQSELSDENAVKLTKINHIKSILNEMESRKPTTQSKALISDGDELLKVIEEKNGAVTRLSQDIASLAKEYDNILPWGEFSPETLKGIKGAGYNIQFLVCNEKNWDEEWRSVADIEVVNEVNGELFLLAISKGEALLQHANLDAVSITQPLSYFKAQIVQEEEELDRLNRELDDISSYASDVLKQSIANIEGELDFSKALSSGDKVADDKLVILSGWVPTEQELEFNAKMDSKGLLYLSEAPTPQDAMPIKLRNNKFSKLFEVIGDLYTLPKQNELDLTPFFAPFYMLFFGFCLGDAGYGSLIMLGTLFGLSKASEKVKPLLWLGFFLGLSTTIMGLVGGTAFGVMFAEMETTSGWFKEYQSWILSTDNLMVLSLCLGFVQVVFGMVLKAINLARGYGFKYAVSQIGWILIVGIALPFYGLGMQEMMDVSTANNIAATVAIVGAIPALFYNTPGKNPFLNLGSGLWETYGMASGLLGDVLSYIRLFALGLSSAILGNVFNMLAFNLSPDIPVIGILVTILILAFGHSLNFFMALLGSFVHPLRLTFVEFYKNAGFEGGGEKYAPFRK